MNDPKQSREYATIRDFYGTRMARRHDIPLIRHIDRGLEILQHMGASDDAKRAFCLHPIVQMGDTGVDVSWSEVLPLAEEYARKANSYLCVPETDHIRTLTQMRELIGTMSEDCRMMLVADKQQNRESFLTHHFGHHPRSAELQSYFERWLDYLDWLALHPWNVDDLVWHMHGNRVVPGKILAIREWNRQAELDLHVPGGFKTVRTGPETPVFSRIERLLARLRGEAVALAVQEGWIKDGD